VTDDSAQIQGTVDVAPLVDPTILADNPGTSITKVEYYLGKTLVSTQKTAPFTYTFDTKKLKNGTYNMVIKTYYSNGSIDTTNNKLLVKNPVTLSYVLAHYATDILVTLIVLVILALVIWKFIWPRFGGGGLAGAGAGGDGYGGDMGMGGPTDYMANDTTTYEAPEPSVVTPGNSQSPSNVVTPGQAAAAQQTPALSGQTQPAGSSETEFNPNSFGVADENAPANQVPPTGAAPQAGQPPAASPPAGQQPSVDPNNSDRHLY
jgi:hypothetical protein